jgi:formylglycine-generating enzyme required for sulfatase activity
LNEPRIFLCHASEDKPRVAELYHQLKQAGYHPWLDKEDLLPGQSWKREIRKIISDPYNIVVVCLSCKSTTKRGVVQGEIRWALDVLDRMPEGNIYLIPARLEPCQVPDRLSQLHWVDLFEPDGFEKLKCALEFEIVKRRQPFEPELVFIPAGEFLMGSDPIKDKDATDGEQPQHRLYLPDYAIAKTPVTNAQYLAFMRATNHDAPEHWEGRKPPVGEEDHPVVNVSWHSAMAYCSWLSEVTGKPYRLPSEAEWEKGARGTDGRIYPWGNAWDTGRCNSSEGGKGRTTPVGSYPQGASPYGLLDMAGNVWEWCHSLYGPYPYNAEDGREDAQAGGARVLRGGAFLDDAGNMRCAAHLRSYPVYGVNLVGFRIVLAPGFCNSGL